MATRAAGIEVDEHPTFERRWRYVVHAGSAVGALLVVAGVIGLFGTGPLAHATNVGAGGVQVEYDRFVRSTASTTIQVSVPRAAGQVQVALSQDYLDHADVSAVDPQAEHVTNLPDRRVYTVLQHGAGEVDIEVTPLTIGVRHLTIWVMATGKVALTQVVWP